MKIVLEAGDGDMFVLIDERDEKLSQMAMARVLDRRAGILSEPNHLGSIVAQGGDMWEPFEGPEDPYFVEMLLREIVGEPE